MRGSDRLLMMKRCATSTLRIHPSPSTQHSSSTSRRLSTQCINHLRKPEVIARVRDFDPRVAYVLRAPNDPGNLHELVRSANSRYGDCLTMDPMAEEGGRWFWAKVVAAGCVGLYSGWALVMLYFDRFEGKKAMKSGKYSGRFFAEEDDEKDDDGKDDGKKDDHD